MFRKYSERHFGSLLIDLFSSSVTRVIDRVTKLGLGANSVNLPLLAFIFFYF